MALTTYASHGLINHILRNAPMPASKGWLALFTTPTDDNGGGTEVVGGSYVRIEVPFTAPLSKATSGEQGETITFLDLPACTVTHAALMDAETGGNMLSHNSLPQPRTVPAGDNLTFAGEDVDFLLS